MKKTPYEIVSSLIKDNLELFYNKEEDRIEINADYIAEQIVDHIHIFPRQFLLNQTNIETLESCAKQCYDEARLIGDTEGMPADKAAWEIYYDGFFSGYVNSFEDATGEDFFDK